MEFIKQQVQVTLTKTEMAAVIAEAMQDPAINTAIKRAISPVLATAFPQFPEHSQITVMDTDPESGATVVILKQKPVKKEVVEEVLEDRESLDLN